MALTEAVDISNHQKQVDHEAMLAAGYVGAIVKATESTDFKDGWFPRNWGELARLNAVRGAYAFGRPSAGEARPDAQAYLDYVTANGWFVPGDIPVLDMEDERVPAGVDLSGWTLEWLGYVESQVGCPPWLYSGFWYTSTRGLTVPSLARFPLWWAAYRQTKPTAMMGAPAPWSAVTLWQWTSSGSVPGVNGDCDCNVTDLTADQLRALGVPGAADGGVPDVVLDKETQRRAKVLLQEIMNRAVALNEVLKLPDWPDLE